MLKILQIRKKSIKNQLLIDFGAILLSVCVISYLGVYWVFTNLLEKNQEDTTDMITNVAISQAQVMINTVETIIDKVANIELLQNTSVPIEERLKVAVSNAPIMYQLGIFDQNGTGMTSTGEKHNIKDQVIFQQAMMGEVSGFQITKYEEQNYIAFLGPIINDQGEVQSLVVVFRRLEDFFERIMQVSKGELCYILNDKDVAFWGICTDDGISRSGKIEDTKDLQKIFESELVYDHEYMMETKEIYSGEPVMLTYGLVEEPNWIIGVARLMTDQKDEFRVFHSAMFLGMILVLIIGMVIVYVIVSSISKRMNGIASYLESSIKNEFKETMPPEFLKDEDEIGKIAKEVKHLEEEMVEMLDSIKTSIDYLNDFK